MPLLPLGKVTVVTAGTPEQVTKNLSAPNARFFCHSLLIETLPTNTGKIWFGVAGMNKSTYAGVVAVLPIPTANVLPSFSGTLNIAYDAFDLSLYYLDADISGEGVIVTALRG